MTNDDGIDSEGLHRLTAALSAVAEVTVAAPDREYSGASASLGVLGEMRPEVRRSSVEGAVAAWAVNGPPALCVMFAGLGVFGHPFEMVVSGINPGANVGRAVYHSGTIGAALTARSRGMAAVAVSQAVEDFGVEGQGWDEMLREMRWDSAAAVAVAVTRALIGEGVPAPLVLNLNVPNLDLGEMKGWQRSVIGRVPPRVISEAWLDPVEGHPGLHRVVMEWGDAVSLPEESDGGAIERGKVAVSLLAQMSDVSTPAGTEAEDAAFPAVAAALDSLLGQAS